MKVLLDTSVLLWWLGGHRRLRVQSREAIGSSDAVFVSAVSAWEMVIKARLGKLRVPPDVPAAIDHHGFIRLAVGFPHVEALEGLAHHHRDPFDRMLIAQAMAEGLVLVTADRKFEPYGIPILWA